MRSDHWHIAVIIPEVNPDAYRRDPRGLPPGRIVSDETFYDPQDATELTHGQRLNVAQHRYWQLIQQYVDEGYNTRSRTSPVGRFGMDDEWGAPGLVFTWFRAANDTEHYSHAVVLHTETSTFLCGTGNCHRKRVN